MTPDPPPRVAIVVLNWNRWRLTLTCLESLLGLDYPDFAVVLCDNDSTDGTPDRVRAWARGELEAEALPPLPGVPPPAPDATRKPVPFRELTRAEAEAGRTMESVPLTLIHTGANLGFAGGCNVGVRHALSQGVDYVWLLNNDAVVRPDSLRELVKHTAARPDIGICGSTILHREPPYRVLTLGGGRVRRVTGHVWNIGEGSDWPVPGGSAAELEAQPMDYVHGASMFVSRACLEATGLMDEGYFLYFEELDWAARLPPGMRLGYAPSSVVYHSGGGTTGGLLLDYFYRSTLRFTWLHHPVLFPTVAARMVLRLPEAIASRNWRQLRALISLRRPWSERGLASRADA